MNTNKKYSIRILIQCLHAKLYICIPTAHLLLYISGTNIKMHPEVNKCNHSKKKAFKIIKNLRCKHEKYSTCVVFLNAPALAVIYEIKTVFRWTLCYVASYCCNCALAAIICILISMMHSWNSWYAIKATRMINLPYDHRILYST